MPRIRRARRDAGDVVAASSIPATLAGSQISEPISLSVSVRSEQADGGVRTSERLSASIDARYVPRPRTRCCRSATLRCERAQRQSSNQASVPVLVPTADPTPGEVHGSPSRWSRSLRDSMPSSDESPYVDDAHRDGQLSGGSARQSSPKQNNLDAVAETNVSAERFERPCRGCS